MGPKVHRAPFFRAPITFHSKFYRVLPNFTEFYRVLPSFTEFYRVLPGFPRPLSRTNEHRVLQGLRIELCWGVSFIFHICVCVCVCVCVKLYLAGPKVATRAFRALIMFCFGWDGGPSRRCRDWCDFCCVADFVASPRSPVSRRRKAATATTAPTPATPITTATKKKNETG